MRQPGMAIGVTLDLVVTIPLVYFLFIRKSKIPKTTVVPVIILGVTIGTFLLPSHQQGTLEIFKTFALPLIELSVLAFVFIKVRRVIKSYKAQEHKADFFAAFQEVCVDIFPKKVIPFVSMEVAVFYYGFVAWKKKELGPKEYSYHKNTATQAIMMALLFVVLIETIAFHYLLSGWNIYVAWVLTGLSIYTGFQIFGMARSLSKRPISQSENKLHLRYGILGEVDIPFSEIKSLELSEAEFEQKNGFRKLSPLGDMEAHNVILHLKSEHVITSIYGSKKKAKSIAFAIDEPKKFAAELEMHLPHSEADEKN